MWYFSGPILLPQDGKVITLFPLGGNQSILDHQEVLPGSEMVIKSVDLILLYMAMVLNRIQAVDMLSKYIHFLFSFFTWPCAFIFPLLCFTYVLSLYEKGNLCTSLKLIEASGSHRDHPLDLDQDLLTCHQGVEDEVKFPEWDFLY